MSRRFVFLAPPEVGAHYTIENQAYEILASEPYTRRQTGGESALITWETACRGCDKPFTFTTGPTQGDVRQYCRPCWIEWRDEQTKTRKSVRDREREVNRPPGLVEVYRAVQAVQGDNPQPMSWAPNAAKRLCAPTLLRDGYPPLAEHTLAEIDHSLRCAVSRGLLRWDTVGRYGCGHARKGLVARPEDFIKRNGWWPVEEESASVLD